MFNPSLNEKKSDFDWPLHIATLGLALIGTAFIFSVTARQAAHLAWYREDFVRQIIWYVVGFGAAIAFCSMEYGSITRWAAVYYWVAIIILVAIFAVGTIHHGGKRWINLGAFSLQPSEFAKIAFILWMGSYLSRPQEELRMAKVFFACVGYTLLPFILILKEPDLGSALVFLAISLAMMFVAGVPKRMLAGLVGGLGLLAVLVVVAILYLPAKFKVVESYQKDRVLTYLGRDKSKGGSSYNVEQALISVGSGGLTGKGWGQGTQHSLGFLPKEGAHNDFIFSVIAEEEGFVGSVVVLTLYMVLLFSGIKIAGQARDRLGQLLAVGVVTLLFCHVFINIGMNIRLMPVTGIPLPLLSYGGSSVVCSLIAIGILHNVHIYRRSY